MWESYKELCSNYWDFLINYPWFIIGSIIVGLLIVIADIYRENKRKQKITKMFNDYGKCKRLNKTGN